MKVACQHSAWRAFRRKTFSWDCNGGKLRENWKVFFITKKYLRKFNKHIFESERDWNDKRRKFSVEVKNILEKWSKWNVESRWKSPFQRWVDRNRWVLIFQQIRRRNFHEFDNFLILDLWFFILSMSCRKFFSVFEHRWKS